MQGLHDCHPQCGAWQVICKWLSPQTLSCICGLAQGLRAHFQRQAHQQALGRPLAFARPNSSMHKHRKVQVKHHTYIDQVDTILLPLSATRSKPDPPDNRAPPCQSSTAAPSPRCLQTKVNGAHLALHARSGRQACRQACKGLVPMRCCCCHHPTPRCCPTATAAPQRAVLRGCQGSGAEGLSG